MHYRIECIEVQMSTHAPSKSKVPARASGMLFTSLFSGMHVLIGAELRTMWPLTDTLQNADSWPGMAVW